MWLSLLKQHRAIAVIRAPKLEQGRQMAQAMVAGGMQLIEITWNSEKAPQLIAQLRSEFPDCTIGAGTLFTLTDLREAVHCGAQFLFAPHTDPAMIHVATEAGIPLVPGALSPTEIVTAWQTGCSCVKVFPISAVGGVSYIKSLQGPLGQIPLIPTGGVTLENAKMFIEAGAIAVGLAGDLFPKQFIESGDWPAMSAIAQTLVQNLTRSSFMNSL